MGEYILRPDEAYPEETEKKDTYILSREKVIESWCRLIEDGAGKDTWALETIEGMIEDANLPQVRYSQMEVKASMMFGRKRDFLLVTYDGLKEYYMFIGARDFGVHLDVSWFLTFEPGFLKRMISRRMFGNAQALAMQINIFDQQDLSAFTATVHHCVVRTVKMLMEELKQDNSGLNTKSKGFLELW